MWGPWEVILSPHRLSIGVGDSEVPTTVEMPQTHNFERRREEW